jgi:CubicO group peptidase (beta-lactamase class C family)
MPTLRLVALAVLLALPLTARAQAPNVAALADKAALEQFEKQKLVGLGVAVVHDGKIAFQKGYGFADKEKNVAVDPAKSLFRWASCSKPLTAVAALQLVEAGKLDLDKDVREYVPEFPDKGVTLTTRQLLGHQAGIVHYVNGKVIKTERAYEAKNPFEDVVLALDTFKDSPLVNRPGEKYSYTTHGYILLSAVVQRAGKETFIDQVQARILEPLGTTTLQPDYQWKDIPNRAVGYKRAGDKVMTDEDADVSWKLGGGGFLSSTEDFAKFAAGLVNRKLVSEQTEAAMWQPLKLKTGAATNYGLGFTFGKTPGGHSWVGHSGSQEKTRTMMMLVPKSKTAVVVMSNSAWANPSQVAGAVLDAVIPK